jgi:signal transduction histidine kinase
MLFGLLPAAVRETQCASRGAGYCRFDVSWKRSPRHGLLAGAGFGVLAGLGFAWSFGSLAPLWLLAPASLGLVALSAIAGRSLDLARQLEAVAGARRGQLALLDQADRSLAEKMDELAKVGAALDAASASRSGGSLASVRDALTRRAGAGNEPEAEPGESEIAARVAQQIHQALGGLQRRLAELRRWAAQSQPESAGEIGDLVEACVADTRRIQSMGADLARSAEEGGVRRREPFDLGGIVARAVDGIRPSLAAGLELEVDLEQELPKVRCEPLQMEQVVDRLLRNAADASGEMGRVRVKLRGAPSGPELVVEDEGGGMQPVDLERTFDPFASGGDAEAGRGESDLGLCYRVVEQHGGELRVATEEGGGTRVTVVLPRDMDSGGASWRDR